VKLQGQLKDALGSLGGGIIVLATVRQNDKLKADGMVMIMHAEPLAEKLIDCARENEQVYKVLAFLMSSSVWGALVVELAGITMAMASNHGVNVPGLQQPSAGPNPYEFADEAGNLPTESQMQAIIASMTAQNGATAMTSDQWFVAKGA